MLKQDLVYGGYCRIPIGLVGDKIRPELRGREFGRYNDRTSGLQRGKESSE